MGTEFIARGVEVGSCNNYLNVTSPELVKSVHAAYFTAGCDAVITNTFGANSIAIDRYGLADEVEKINLEGVKIARAVADEAARDGKAKYVLGGIGPCGDFIEPLGEVKPADLKEAFRKQAMVLGDGGADGFIIETMTAIEEIEVAVDAVKCVSDLPVFVSLAYDSSGDVFRTMMGVGPADAVERICKLGISAIGFNCGTCDMDEYVRLADIYAELLCDTPVLLLAEPNAGKPELVDGEVVYSLSAEEYGRAMKKIVASPATIVGGCCGTGPGHIAAVARGL
jgi:5-methyltetrahydrofolate--homocysteine methyltransferase